MARNTWTVKSLTQYGLLAIIFLIVYRMYSGDNKPNTETDLPITQDTGGREEQHHPRNVHIPNNERTMEELDKAWGGVGEGEEGGGGGGGGQESWGKHIEDERNNRMERVDLHKPRDGVDELVEEAGESDRNDGSRKREVNLGDLPRDKPYDPHDDLDDLMMKKVKHHFMMDDKYAQKQRDTFIEEGVDSETHGELLRRRAIFVERLNARAEPDLQPDEFKDLHEHETEYFPFATAASHTTYPATLEFIYSIQYFYPRSEIAVYDIGLMPDEKTFINSLCNVVVETMWLHLWPEDMYKNRHRTWRPTLLQFAAGKFTHFVYVEPGRYINKQRLKDYIRHSQRHGVTIVGNQLKYSTFSVTHPHMYAFLPPEDEMLVKKTPHFNFNIIILHNTKRVKHHFMRHLLTCTQEEYCIAPPGAKSGCDANLERTQRWANCHRYDESAISIILNNWHEYKSEEYLMKDAITKHYDGKDVTKKLKMCAPPVENREEI